MAATRTVTNVSAGNDVAATWGGQVFADIGALFSDKTLYTATDAATITFNLNNSLIQTVTLGNNRTLALSNVTTGRPFAIRLTQDATGGRTVTWWSGINWQGGGVTPTLTTAPSKTDTFGFIPISAGVYDGYVVAQNI